MSKMSQEHQKQLEDNAPKLLEALKEISKGEGKYNREPLQHAENTIENMKAIADKAIALVEKL